MQIRKGQGLAGLMQTQNAPLQKPDREIAEAPRISPLTFLTESTMVTTKTARISRAQPFAHRTAAGLILLLVCAGCATPVGVRSITPRAAYQDALANPLSDAVLSDETKVVLDRFDLQRTFKRDPAAAIARLHEKALCDDRRDILYALAEICYLHGDSSGAAFFPATGSAHRIIFCSRRSMPISICLPTCASRRRRPLTSASARPAICTIFPCGGPCQPAMAARLVSGRPAPFRWAALPYGWTGQSCPLSLRALTSSRLV